MLKASNYYRRQAIFHEGQENSAWMISPEGRVYSCGEVHQECLQNEELVKVAEGQGVITQKFQGMDLKLIAKGWARAGVFELGPMGFLECDHVTSRILRAFQGLMFSVGLKDNNKIDVTGSQIIGVTTWKDFKRFQSPEDLIGFLNQRRKSSRSIKAAYDSDQRAWLISPQGKAYPCGVDHEDCSQNQELVRDAEQFLGQEFGSSMPLGWLDELLVEKGWGKAGVFAMGAGSYLQCSDVTTPMLRKFREILSSIGMDDGDSIQVGGKNWLTFKWRNFRWFDSVVDMRKFERFRREGSRPVNGRHGLPKSRNLLRHVKREELPYPLFKAFDVLDLDYKNLSMDQITSAFRRNERFLEDETGRMSHELVQDLNQFLESGVRVW